MVKKIAKQVKTLVKAITSEPTSSVQLTITKRTCIREDIFKKILRMTSRHSDMYTKFVERKNFPSIYKDKVHKLLAAKFSMYYSTVSDGSYELDFAEVSDSNLIFLQREIAEMYKTWVNEIKEDEATPYTSAQRMLLCIIAKAKTEERIEQLQKHIRNLTPY